MERLVDDGIAGPWRATHAWHQRAPLHLIGSTLPRRNAEKLAPGACCVLLLQRVYVPAAGSGGQHPGGLLPACQVTEKFEGLAAEPAWVLTTTGPEVALVGTVTTIWFAVGGEEKAAFRPLKLAFLAPPKP